MNEQARWIVRAASWLLLVGAAFAGVARGQGVGEEGKPAAPAARAVVEKAAEEVLSALREAGLTPGEKKQRVARVVEGCTDFDTMGRLALGPAGRELSEGQRGEFLNEFRKHVLGVCTAGTSRYGGQEVVVESEREGTRGDRVVPVRVVDRKKGAERDVARLDVRLREKEGKWQVIDLSIQGISLAAGFRAQFEAVMKDGGAERLLRVLREKNEKNAVEGEGRRG